MNSNAHQPVAQSGYQSKSEILAVLDNARIKELNNNNLLIIDMDIDELVVICRLARLALDYLPNNWQDGYDEWKKLASGELKLERKL